MTVLLRPTTDKQIEEERAKDAGSVWNTLGITATPALLVAVVRLWLDRPGPPAGVSVGSGLFLAAACRTRIGTSTPLVSRSSSKAFSSSVPSSSLTASKPSWTRRPLWQSPPPNMASASHGTKRCHASRQSPPGSPPCACGGMRLQAKYEDALDLEPKDRRLRGFKSFRKLCGCAGGTSAAGLGPLLSRTSGHHRVHCVPHASFGASGEVSVSACDGHRVQRPRVGSCGVRRNGPERGVEDAAQGDGPSVY